MKRIELSNAARKDLKKIDREAAKAILKDYLPKLEEEPYSGNELSGNLKGLRSYHIKLLNIHYRILYEVGDEVIGVIMISTRENVYKKINHRM